MSRCAPAAGTPDAVNACTHAHFPACWQEVLCAVPFERSATHLPTVVHFSGNSITVRGSVPGTVWLERSRALSVSKRTKVPVDLAAKLRDDVGRLGQHALPQRAPRPQRLQRREQLQRRLRAPQVAACPDSKQLPRKFEPLNPKMCLQDPSCKRLVGSISLFFCRCSMRKCEKRNSSAVQDRTGGLNTM